VTSICNRTQGINLEQILLINFNTAMTNCGTMM
jgi:hypothetical protein